MKKKEKRHSLSAGKKTSEGKMIALIVLLLTLGGIVIYYVLKWVIDLFFPYLF